MGVIFAVPRLFAVFGMGWLASGKALQSVNFRLYIYGGHGQRLGLRFFLA